MSDESKVAPLKPTPLKRWGGLIVEGNTIENCTGFEFPWQNDDRMHMQLAKLEADPRPLWARFWEFICRKG